MYRAHTVSVGIAVNPRLVYDYASDPANLPVWAPGFVQAIEKRGLAWFAQTSLGEVQFRFAATNELGVLDQDMDTVRADLNKLRTVLEHRYGSAA